MFRVFAVSLFVALSVSLVFAQAPPQPPMPPPQNIITANPVEGTFTARDPAVPVIFFQDIGFHEEVILDSMKLSNLAMAPMEIVPAPTGGETLVPRGLIVKKTGTATIPDAADGSVAISLGVTNLASGIMPIVSPTHNDNSLSYRNFWSESINHRSFSTVGLLFNAAGPITTFQTLPSGVQKVNLFQGQPIKLSAVVYVAKANTTPADTWRGLIANLAGDFRLTLLILYEKRVI